MLAFKVFRPVKYKHNLSINLLICLVGIYSYSKMIDNTFSRTNIFKFVTYFSYPAIKRYFEIYIQRGLVIPCVMHGSRQYYKLSEQAIAIVQEIPQSYNRVMYEFSNKYNVSL